MAISNLPPLPVALAHRIPGRARLNFEVAEGQEEAATGFVNALLAHPAVQEARVNPRGHSVLVLHRGELSAILDEVEARGLIRLQAARAPGAMLSLSQVRRAIDVGDVRLLEGTSGGVGLAGLAFAAFTAAGIWQALNGQLLPAGATLFHYALGVMQWGAERETPTPTTTVQS